MKKLTKDELSNIYHQNSNKEACKILEITNSTLTKYLRKANIPLKGSGNGASKHRSKIELL